MPLDDAIDEIDTPLEEYRDEIGGAYEAVRNHIYRVYHYTLSLADDKEKAALPTAIAGVFHDLGVFTTRSMDYIDPSVTLARDYMSETKRLDQFPLVADMIRFHHKLTPYKGDSGPLVESFRRADLADLSMGYKRGGVSRSLIKEAFDTFPSAGFHKTIFSAVSLWAIKNPLNPLPMMRR